MNVAFLVLGVIFGASVINSDDGKYPAYIGITCIVGSILTTLF